MTAFDAQLRRDAVRFSVPVDGMANETLIDFLSQSLDTARRNITIVSGHSSRTKVVEVRGLDLKAVQQLAE